MVRPDGAHTVNLRTHDAQGNQSTPILFDWRLDTLAPLITLTSPTEGDAADHSLRG